MRQCQISACFWEQITLWLLSAYPRLLGQLLPEGTEQDALLLYALNSVSLCSLQLDYMEPVQINAIKKSYLPHYLLFQLRISGLNSKSDLVCQRLAKKCCGLAIR